VSKISIKIQRPLFTHAKGKGRRKEKKWLAWPRGKTARNYLFKNTIRSLSKGGGNWEGGNVGYKDSLRKFLKGATKSVERKKGFTV